MRSKARKTVHKRLKNKKGTNTQEKSKSPVVLTLPPVPHKTWIRPRYHEAHRMYVLKLVNEFGKPLIRMYRSSKEELDKLYKKLVNA